MTALPLTVEKLWQMLKFSLQVKGHSTCHKEKWHEQKGLITRNGDINSHNNPTQYNKKYTYEIWKPNL